MTAGGGCHKPTLVVTKINSASIYPVISPCASITAMSDGLDPSAGVIAAIARGIRALVPSGPRPKLKVGVAGRRETNNTLWVWARVTNEGGASITIDTVSSWVRASRGRRGIEPVEFNSGPNPPFRLDSYSSAKWEARIKIRDQWMLAKNVDCTVFVSGGGESAYKVSKIVDR